MRRLLAGLLCLLLCLIVQDRWSRHDHEGRVEETASAAPASFPAVFAAGQQELLRPALLTVLAWSPLPFPASCPWGGWQQLEVHWNSPRLRQDLLASLACTPCAGFPANLSWAALQRVGGDGLYPLDYVLHHDPALFLQMCLERYHGKVKGYSGTFRKRECLLGKLQPPEKIDIHFREQPFSVFMHWKQGARRVERSLYVAGENNSQALVRPAGFLRAIGVIAKDPESNEARRESRYTLKEFGLGIGMQRTIDGMLEARRNQALFVTYQGICRLPEAGHRPCYKFLRTPFVPPAEEGLNELTLYIDTQTWLQVGSILRTADGKLIGEYYFSDLQLNPKFAPAQFKRGAL